MKIVSITPDIDSGGAAKSLFVLSRALAEKGHALRIMTTAKPSRTNRKVEELSAMGVEVHYFDIPYFPIRLIVCPIPFWKNVWRTVARLGEFRRLVGEVNAFGPDLVHYNSYTTLHTSTLLGAFPSVLHAREVLVEPAPTLPGLKALMRSRINEVIAISPEEGEQADRLFSIPVTTIFNSPSNLLRYEPFPEGEPIVYGAFSHITPIKGQLELVRACVRAADALRSANVRVRIYGGAVGIHQGYLDSVIDEIAVNNLGDVVSFEGFTDQPEEEMRRCHLIVRPDATGQPWGRDVIESLSMGRPVLATGSSQTFIKPGKNGMLIPPRDVPRLAEALTRMADRSELERMGRAAYDFACENLNPGTNIARVIDTLERVARQPR